MTSSSVHSATSLIDPADTFFVIGAAIFTSLLSEGTQSLISLDWISLWILFQFKMRTKRSLKDVLNANVWCIGISWLLIYRHQEYKTLILNIDGLSRKIEKQKDQQIYQGAAAKNKT